MKKQLLSLGMALAFVATMNAQNLLNDGGFDTDGLLVGRTADEWGMYSGNGGTAEVINGVCTVTPVTNANNWEMQVEQWNAAIENDLTYTIQFDAWADADRVIALTVEDPNNGYAQLGASDNIESLEGRSKWDINITTEQTQYTLTFTVDGINGNTAVKFAFLMAQSNELVYLDNVSLVEGLVSNPEKEMSALSVYPNPANGFVTVKASKGDNVEIYNIAGQQLATYILNSNVERIDLTDFVPGVYMVKIANNVERLVIR